MSKTTPEEAIALAAKHNVWLWMADEERFKRLAALIDEVRGVDAEPVGYMKKHICSVCRDIGSVGEPPIPCAFCKTANLGKKYREFEGATHPAPSQPAAPVELPVVGYLPGPDGEPLVKLSDAQAAIAAGRKAS